MRLLFVIVAVISIAGATACSDSGDSTNGGDTTDVKTLCGKIFECGGYGFADEAACEADFLGNATMGTTCADESGFLSCVAGDLDKDCPVFQNSEAACWDDHCK